MQSMHFSTSTSFLMWLLSFGWCSVIFNARLSVVDVACLRQLEVLRNSENGSEHGSLLWLLSHTSTSFGRRLLRYWVSRPLRCRDRILDRLDAVEELLETASAPALSEYIILQRLVQRLFVAKFDPWIERTFISTLNPRLSCTDELVLIFVCTMD